MKKLVEVENESLEALLGETITILGVCYFYTGKLVGVNDMCVKLENPSIIYQTGAWDKGSWEDAQKLPGDIYVMLSQIESYGPWGK